MSDTKLLPKTITNSKMTKSYLLESDPYLKTSTKTSSPFVLSTNNNNNNNSNGNSTMMIGCNELEHQFIRSNWGNLGATSNLTLGPVAETNESTMTTTNNTSSTTSTTNPTTINYNQYSHLNGIPHELISDYQRPLVKPLALHNVPSNVPPIAYINGNSVRPIRTRHYSQQQTAFLHNQQPQNNGTNGNSGNGNDNNNSQNNNHNINGETSSKKLNSGNFKVVVAPGDTQHYGLASSDIKKSVKNDNSSRTLTSGSSNVMMEEASKGVESSQGTTLNVCSNNNNNNHNTSSTSTMLAPIKSKIKVQSMPIAIQHQQQQQQSSQDKAMQAKPKQSSYYNSKQQKQQQSALNLASSTTTSTTTTAMTSTSTSASVRDYVTNNDYESSIYSLYENTEQVIEFMAKRMNSILRQAKENRRLVCTELLVPHMLLAQIASDVIQMSECEPCGLRGCLLYICIEDTGAYGGGGSGSGSHHAKQHPKSSTSSISSFSSSSSNCSSSSSSSSSNHSSFSSCSSSTCSSSSDSHHHSYHPNHHSHSHHQPPQPPCSHPHHQGSIYSNQQQQQHQYHLQQQAQPLASRLLGEFAIDRNVVPTFEVFLTLKRATPNWFESLEIKLLGKERIVLSEVYLLHKKKLYQPSSPTL